MTKTEKKTPATVTLNKKALEALIASAKAGKVNSPDDVKRISAEYKGQRTGTSFIKPLFAYLVNNKVEIASGTDKISFCYTDDEKRAVKVNGKLPTDKRLDFRAGLLDLKPEAESK